ncbi:MAG: lipopolysaccharide heptosyltransferase II [Lautropia sp.]
MHSPRPARRALVVAPLTLTEALLSQPLIALLRRLDPGGRLDVLASQALAPLYRAMPEIDDVVAGGLDAAAPDLPRHWRLSRRLSERHYDDAYVLAQARTAGLAPWLARIPNRVGLADRASAGAPRRSATPGLSYPSSLTYARLAFDAQAALPPGIPTPQIGRPPSLDAATLRLLGLEPKTQVFLFCATSDLGPASQWPARHFVALSASIHASWPDAMVALVGDRSGRETAAHVSLMSGGRIRNLAGRLDLSQTMALMQHASAIVGGESQHMLLAAALRRPHVTLYGAGDPRAERLASARRKVLWLKPACSPCLDAHCRFGHAECLSGITPLTVHAALRQVLEFSACL